MRHDQKGGRALNETLTLFLSTGLVVPSNKGTHPTVLLCEDEFTAEQRLVKSEAPFMNSDSDCACE